MPFASQSWAPPKPRAPETGGGVGAVSPPPAAPVPRLQSTRPVAGPSPSVVAAHAPPLGRHLPNRNGGRQLTLTPTALSQKASSLETRLHAAKPTADGARRAAAPGNPYTSPATENARFFSSSQPSPPMATVADRLDEKGRSTPPVQQRARRPVAAAPAAPAAPAICRHAAAVTAASPDDSPEPKDPNARWSAVAPRATVKAPPPPLFHLFLPSRTESHTEGGAAPPQPLVACREGSGVSRSAAADVPSSSVPPSAPTADHGAERHPSRGPATLADDSIDVKQHNSSHGRADSRVGSTLGPSYHLAASREGDAGARRCSRSANEVSLNSSAVQGGCKRPVMWLPNRSSTAAIEAAGPAAMRAASTPPGKYRLLDDDYRERQRNRYSMGSLRLSSTDVSLSSSALVGEDGAMLAFQRKLELEQARLRAELQLRAEQRIPC